MMADNTGEGFLSMGGTNPMIDTCKCLTCGRDKVQKQWNKSAIKSELLIVELKIKNSNCM
jgi:hypothetical protein